MSWCHSADNVFVRLLLSDVGLRGLLRFLGFGVFRLGFGPLSLSLPGIRFGPKALIPFQVSNRERRNSSRSRPNSFAQCPAQTLPSRLDPERSGHGSVSRSLVGSTASCWLYRILAPVSTFSLSRQPLLTNSSKHQLRGHFMTTRKVSGIRVESGISSFVPKPWGSLWTQGSPSAPVWNQIGPRRVPVSSWTFAGYPER